MNRRLMRVVVVVQAFFAVLATLFALGLPNTMAPFVVMVFFTVMIVPGAMFFAWACRELDI